MTKVAIAAVLCALTARARADANADIGLAVQAFVDAAAAGKLPADVQAFVGPDGFDIRQAVQGSDEFVAMVRKPKVMVTATNIVKSGTLAWVVGSIPARYRAEYGDKPAEHPLRVSAVLTLDGTAWHVRAAHVSGTTRDPKRTDRCGNIMQAYHPEAHVAKGTEPVVQMLSAAFFGSHLHIEHDSSLPRDKIIKILSSDPRAQMLGSAANETATGASVKRLVGSWDLDVYLDRDAAQTGISPAGDAVWVMSEIQTFALCLTYRVLFVVQKEGAEWRIVHQHYSQGVHASE